MAVIVCREVVCGHIAKMFAKIVKRLPEAIQLNESNVYTVIEKVEREDYAASLCLCLQKKIEEEEGLLDPKGGVVR